jgi:DNA-binding MarR family transcriptional regulator
VLLFLRRHANAKLTDAATALRLRPPTLSEVVNDLVRKRWVTKRRSVTDARVVHLSLSRRGPVLAQKIEEQVRQVGTGGRGEQDSDRRRPEAVVEIARDWRLSDCRQLADRPRGHLSRAPRREGAVTRNVGYTSRRSFENGNGYGAVGFGAGRPVSCWEQRSMRGHA